MKHYLHHAAITAAMLAIATGAQAQTEYLQTSFDDGMPAAFTLIDHDQRTPQKEMRQMGFETGRPWIVVNEGSEGNRAAVSTSYYEDSGRASDWMITPPMTVSSPKAVLRWRSRAQAQDFPDGLTVYVAPSSPDPQPSSFSTTLYRSSAESHRWTDHEVSLADYVGQTIRVAFVNESNDCMCLYVDDIFAGVPTTVGMTLDFDRTYNGYGRIAVSGTDRPDPEAQQHPRESRAEERIIAYLLRFPSEIEQVREAIPPELFVTEFHRRVYAAICQADWQEFSLSLLADQFSVDEMSRITGISAQNAEVSLSRDDIQEFAVLLRKAQDSPVTGSELTDDDLLRAVQNRKHNGQ